MMIVRRSLDVPAVEHRREHRLHLRQRHIGEEAQAPLVDADQRHAVGRQLAGDREHRAVAAEHDGEVDGGAERGGIDDRIHGAGGRYRRLGRERDLVAARGEEIGEARQRLGQAGSFGASDSERDAGEACGQGRGHGSD